MLSVEKFTFRVSEYGEYTQDVQQRFQTQFSETRGATMQCNAMRQLIQKFKDTCSFCEAIKSGIPSSLREDKVYDTIANRVFENV